MLPGMKLAFVVVILAAAFKHTIIWYSIGSLNIEDKVLYKIDFIN
jgi:hypothetical protein